MKLHAQNSSLWFKDWTSFDSEYFVIYALCKFAKQGKKHNVWPDVAQIWWPTHTKHVIASLQVEDFKAENKRFGLCIDMMSPTILIPQSSTSTDLILLRSGDLHVENVFDTTDLGQGVKQEWNHIYVSLTDVLLNRYKLKDFP